MWLILVVVMVIIIGFYIYVTHSNNINSVKNFYNDDSIIRLMVGDMFGKMSWHSPYTVNGKTDYQILKSYINPKSVVLDFGCGVGGTAIKLAKELNCTVYGLNISKKQKDIMKSNIESEGLSKQVFCILYDGITFPECLYKEPKLFDAVIFQESMCHVKDKYNVFKQIKRLLKSNGIIFGQDWFKLKDSQNIEKTDFYYKTKLETPQTYIDHLNRLGFTNIQFTDLKNKSKDLNKIFPKKLENLDKNNPIEMGGASMSRAFHNDEFTIGILTFNN